MKRAYTVLNIEPKTNKMFEGIKIQYQQHSFEKNPG